MRKYLVIAVVIVLFLAGGYFIEKKQNASKEVAITVHAKKMQWQWDNTDIKVRTGDTVKITFVNEDDFDHGIGIDGYNINQKIPAGQTITINFVANRKGKFNFYCSVPCGQGIVNGQERDHFDMVGDLEVT